MFAFDKRRTRGRRPGQHHRRSHSRFLVISAVCIAPTLLHAQSGLLEARIVSGDGQVIREGERIQRPLVVEVTDETGALVDRAIVSFRLPEDGVSGTFRNGLKTEILTTDGGHASLRSLQAGGFAGQFQVRVTVAKGEARAGTLSTQFIAPDSRKHPLHSLIGAHPHLWEAAGVLLLAAAADYAKGRTSTAGGANATLPPTFGVPTGVVGKP